MCQCLLIYIYLYVSQVKFNLQKDLIMISVLVILPIQSANSW